MVLAAPLPRVAARPAGVGMADGSPLDVAERWYSAREVAEISRLTKRAIELRANREAWSSRPRPGRGGGKEYAFSALPPATQAALLLRDARPAPVNATCARLPKWTEARIQSAWERYEAVKQPMKAAARRRLSAIHAIEALQRSGTGLMQARAIVAAQLQREGVPGASAASIARWQDAVDGAHRSDWLALLVPHYTGRTATAEIPADAWDMFKADYLRLEAPSATSCYDRLQRIAATKQWPPLPALATFERKLRRELSPQVLVLAREGEEALMRTYPAQERDRTGFAALEGVNADGHMWDVSVQFPDGRIGRPIIVGWQDLGSGKILAWRIGESESSDLVRLAFADLVTKYGIPAHAWLDNGRSFASKYLTGGTRTRYRFKVREEDPKGIFVSLGTDVHWVTPYHGQAKPIERAWRDFCDRIAKHPAFAGAYLGNNPTNKPENYGARSVPWAEFIAVVDSEIAAHNAREGRASKVCNGRSFDQVFAASYATATIRKASADQLRMLLLAAEAVMASNQDGSVRLAGNRYWTEALSRYAGRKVVIRFDPMQLHAGVHAYGLDGSYIGYADCTASVGFADTNAAREHAQAKKHYRKAAKQQLAAERRMEAAEVAAQLPTMLPPEIPAAGVVAPVFGLMPPRKDDILHQRTGTDDADAAGNMCAQISMARKKRRDEEGI